ncbi:LysR family transcriptional regulator [Micrococcales bacterium 31B]|nr:LysR family transcriptional regulator [Micrococcales bacterium 31B]
MTEIRWLEAFVAVAEELHFGRAATRLHTSQSPLSQTIKKLEADLGTPLFERNTRSVSLTPSGHALLPRAYRVLREMRAAREAAQAEKFGIRGTLRIGFSGAVNNLTLPPLTRAIRSTYPDVELELFTGVRTRDGLARIVNGTLDLAFVGYSEILGSQVNAQMVAREMIGAVLPQDHPLAGEASIDARMLANDDFISPPTDGSSSATDALFDACGAAGFRPNIVQELSDPYMVLTFVAAGAGVTLMSSGVVSIVPSGAVFVPLHAPEIYMNHAIAWSADNDSALLAAAVAVIRDTFPTFELPTSEKPN